MEDTDNGRSDSHTYDDLMNYSPMLAGRKGLQSKYMTTAGMALQFRELLDEIQKDECTG
jgi:hypothetical protein